MLVVFSFLCTFILTTILTCVCAAYKVPPLSFSGWCFTTRFWHIPDMVPQFPGSQRAVLQDLRSEVMWGRFCILPVLEDLRNRAMLTGCSPTGPLVAMKCKPPVEAASTTSSLAPQLHKLVAASQEPRALEVTLARRRLGEKTSETAASWCCRFCR